MNRPAPLNKRQPVTCGLEATIKVFSGTQTDQARYVHAFETYAAKRNVTMVTGKLPGPGHLYFTVKRTPAAGNNTADIQKQLDAVAKQTGLAVSYKIESCVRTDVQARVDAPEVATAEITHVAKKIAKGCGVKIKSILIEFE